MANGSFKLVSEVKKGDMIASPNGKPSKILCVLKFTTQNSKAKLCSISGLYITHRHPIQVAGTWLHPESIAPAVLTNCSAIYNFIVDHSHIAILNKIPVILLGHNYTSGILKDEYLGSDRIINDLKEMPGWKDGLIGFGPGCFLK